MSTPIRSQRRYDHRLREHVRTTQDTNCALQQGVPRSTAPGWLKTSGTPEISVNPLELDTARLQQEVLRLRSRTQKLMALLRVLLVVLRMSGYALNQIRLAGGNHKRSLLRAIPSLPPVVAGPWKNGNSGWIVPTTAGVIASSAAPLPVPCLAHTWPPKGISPATEEGGDSGLSAEVVDSQTAYWRAEKSQTTGETDRDRT